MSAETEVLIAQIDALTEQLQRGEAVLKSESIEREYRMPIYGKFARAISPLMRRLEQLRCTAAKDSLAPEELDAAWREFTEAYSEGQRVFAQCLDFLGGIAVRRMGLERGICGVAERLVGDFAFATGVPWSSVMILGEERLFDDVAQITQIIRMRFPEWDVWSLPFTAHEFGQLVASGESVRGLREFMVDEERRLRRLIEDAQIQQAELQAVAPTIRALRAEYVGTRNAVAVEQFLAQQRHHLHSLFADIFATYFLGPAYVYARLFLRFVPTAAFTDEPASPSEARRMAVMVSTLQQMSQAEKHDPYAEGAYDAETRRFEALWENTVKAVTPGYEEDFIFGAPYDGWFTQLFNLLRTEHGLVGFKAADWEKAQVLSDGLLQFQPPPPGLSLPVILNAAWHCRVRHPERVEDIEKRARELAEELQPTARVSGQQQASTR